MLRRRYLLTLVSTLAFLAPSCSSSTPATVDQNAPFTGADIGPEGGEVVGPIGSEFHGIALKIPAGALSAKVHVSFQGLIDETPLPDTAERVGPAFKILPEGTKLAKPAELTLPVSREMVGAYNQSAADCKVWARKDAGWERVDKLRNTDDSVTISIPAFTTAAAGVNFSIQNSCLKAACEPVPAVPTTFQSLAQTCQPVDNAPYCLIKLPIAEKTRGIDEFASLNVRGHMVYWASTTDDGFTIARYDLDRPSDPIFRYPAYTGSVNGALATRGIVSVDGTGGVWLGFSGVGNVRFAENQPPVLFDTGTAAGVGATPSGNIRRFVRQNVVSNGLVSKTDIRVYTGTGNDSDFAFNYPISPGENIMAFGTDSSPTPHMFLRSTHRGIAETYRGSQLSDFMVWTAQDAKLGTVSDDDPSTFGAAAFAQNFGVGAVVRGSRVELRTGEGFKNLIVGFSPPGGVRDVAFNNAGSLFAVSSNAEYYLLGGSGQVVMYQLPESEPGMVPWRLRNIPNSTDMLLVTRGPLVSKGVFYILRMAALAP